MKKTVLIADDSESVRKIVSSVLTEMGCRIVEAKNGKDALVALSINRIDLVITDVNMPELDGIGLIRKVRTGTDHRFVPIVILTSTSEKGRRLEGQAAGASAWIDKQLVVTQLREVVEKFLK